MTHYRTYSLALAGILSLSFNLPHAESPKSAIEVFSWMAGCWEGKGDNRQLEEHWTQPAGQSMLGMSRVLAGGKTVAFEFMRILEDERGIVFIAQPSGQKETPFRLSQFKNQQATFENPDHDFPQRIIYRKEPDGSLLARIEGKENGKELGMDFPMKPGKCR